MTDERIISKIEKLYNLAKNNPSEAQSEAALLKANELMTLYNIEIGQLDLEKKTGREYAKEEITYTKIPTETAWVRLIIDEFFFVKTVSSPQRGSSTLHFIGTKENVEIAIYVYEQLTFNFYRLWQVYKIRNNAKTTTKQAYYAGLMKGLQDKLRSQRKHIEESHALVIVDDPGIEKATRQHFPRLVMRTRRYNSDDRATEAGIRDGRNININAGIGGSNQNQKNLR
jgi:hypothetical protein